MRSFYTRTGDEGQTGLIGSERVDKFDIRIETLGTLDEANAAIGIARAFNEIDELKEIMLQTQRNLYRLMSELGASDEAAEHFIFITDEEITALEAQVDSLSSKYKPPRAFIVPGDTKSGAYLDLARTIIRRAERRVTELNSAGLLRNKLTLKYINRLSSLLFALEIAEYLSQSDSVTLAKKKQ